MQDSRAALDFIHDWRHSAKGKVTRDEDSGDFWTGSIKLRRVINEQGSIATDQYAAAPRFQKRKNINRAIYNDMPEVMQYYGGPERDRYLRNKGLSRNTDNTLGEQSWFVGQAENDLYLETFKQSMKELYTAQKSAALSMGFKDKYKFEPLETRNITSNYVHGTDRGYEDYMNTAGAIEDKYGYEDFRFLNMVKTNGWYHLYTDNSWEIPELRTAQDLHAELLDIEEAGDAQYAGTEHYRNTQQRQYLSTKAITRYWAQKIDGLGGGPQLLDAMQTAEKQEYSPETPHSKAHYPINGPPAFWQPGDDLNDEHGMGLGWHYGSDPGVQDAIDPEWSQAVEDTDKRHRERAMELYQAWGIAGDGANDPDFIAGRFGGDFMKYWEATGRDAPYEDGVQQVWDQGKMEWVAPEEPEEAKGPEYTGPELDMLKQEWEQGGAFADVPIPGADFPEREGWHYSQLENVIVAPDGTKFSPVGDNTRIFLHEQELLDAAAAAEQKKVDDQKAEDEAAAEQEKAAHEAATEQQKAEDEQKAADEQKKTDDAQKAADEQKAAEDAAKAAEDAAAAQKVIDDAAAAKKAAEDAAAQADEDTAAAQDTDQDTPGPVYTFHHGEQFHFHHDTTVPLHIPGTSKTQSQVPKTMPKNILDFDPEEDEMGSADAWIGGHIDG